MIKPKEEPGDWPLGEFAAPVTRTSHHTRISPVPGVKDLPRHISFCLACAWGV